ncbi:uncharacterized protein LOC110841520 isoform X2 [Zootermopsis nevadensis]|nr:uncharacterized protein LOC110841520 isoform X2 [Zootermopsis nevadensis]XP_021942848.1 uncharacterized protein LOC110841520 isoform X2 [Zootermopsis nevadensis]XP_021942849.1 uncharacterized protein LOC110841520 isoform X2 [Zootermopsis nevadensis]XP_021942850.1 uncharacterized protein LOC110841520 isoform X2 [Zootermopsis nevadensis]
MSSKIHYPVEGLLINAEQPLQDLITELKNLLLYLQRIGKEDTTEGKHFDEFIPLLQNLVNPDFLCHEDPLVKMIVACCLGQLLGFLPVRSFRWDDEELVVLLDFFIKQLECFGTSDGIILKYCVILLKILSTADSFSRLFVCLEYTTNKENIYNAFLLTVCMAARIKRDISMMEMYVVLLLKNFINNTKYTSSTGIDIILCSILRENIEDYPTMYHVAVKVIRNCIRALDFPTKMVCTMTSVV